MTTDAPHTAEELRALAATAAGRAKLAELLEANRAQIRRHENGQDLGWFLPDGSFDRLLIRIDNLTRPLREQNELIEALQREGGGDGR